VIVCRESSFGAGGWLLAGSATPGWNARVRRVLVTTGRVIIPAAAIFYGVQHLLHPLHVPGVPLERVLPEWMPARALVGCLTGAVLLVCGAGMLVRRTTRATATYLGAWILLLVVVVYGPLLVESMRDPSTAARVQGINYFTDTLLFAGAILALAGASGSAARTLRGRTRLRRRGAAAGGIARGAEPELRPLGVRREDCSPQSRLFLHKKTPPPFGSGGSGKGRTSCGCRISSGGEPCRSRGSRRCCRGCRS
jgi:uncharacterized membrane protein